MYSHFIPMRPKHDTVSSIFYFLPLKAKTQNSTIPVFLLYTTWEWNTTQFHLFSPVLHHSKPKHNTVSSLYSYFIPVKAKTWHSIICVLFFLPEAKTPHCNICVFLFYTTRGQNRAQYHPCIPTLHHSKPKHHVQISCFIPFKDQEAEYILKLICSPA